MLAGGAETARLDGRRRAWATLLLVARVRRPPDEKVWSDPAPWRREDGGLGNGSCMASPPCVLGWKRGGNQTCACMLAG